ncbi:MAG: hypothetical protein LBI62_08040 [Candidatus Accumulibacter sp.]|jgi:hypothetical protein|nr:hypothetical protein [Accumulibacter sp.]
MNAEARCFFFSGWIRRLVPKIQNVVHIFHLPGSFIGVENSLVPHGKMKRGKKKGRLVRNRERLSLSMRKDVVDSGGS